MNIDLTKSVIKFLMLVKMELLANVFVEQLCYLQPTGKIDDKSFNIWIKIIKVKE